MTNKRQRERRAKAATGILLYAAYVIVGLTVAYLVGRL